MLNILHIDGVFVTFKFWVTFIDNQVVISWIAALCIESQGTGKVWLTTVNIIIVNQNMW